jgi:group I intron endonuclease
MIYIYFIHNIINNKIYIGKTNNTIKRWNKHIKISRGKRNEEKFYLHKALNKYGVNNFTFQKLQCFNNIDDANNAEMYWISFFQSNNSEFGYNLTAGGEGTYGRIISENTRNKIRQKALGRKHTKETIISISGNNNHGAKLKEKDIIIIRDKFYTNNCTLVELAEEFKVSPKCIKHIVSYSTWKHVGPYRKYKKVNLALCSSKKRKLTNKQAADIRTKYKGNNVTQKELANIYGVGESTIYRIVNNQGYKHI